MVGDSVGTVGSRPVRRTRSDQRHESRTGVGGKITKDPKKKGEVVDFKLLSML